MKSIRTLAVGLGVAALTIAGMGTANATSSSTCSGGPVSGHYANLVIKGDCTVPDNATLHVRGDVTLAPHSSFNTSTVGSHVKIGGNVVAGPHSMLALGCTQAHPCDNPTGAEGQGKPGTPYSDKVRGNVVLDHVFGAAINGVVIGGNLTSIGGGPGINADAPPFSVKDDKVHGNIVIKGLRAGWFGVIRTEVGGNVVLIGNRSANKTHMEQDSSEVVANTIGGNLFCSHNYPAAQFGDAIMEPGLPPGYGPNDVDGVATGECAALAH